MKNAILLLFFQVVLLCSSCSYFGPNPPDMTGKFEVTFSLDEELVDTKNVRKSVGLAISEAKDEIKKSRSEIQKELNLNSIDTSTVEGKWEYNAKKIMLDLTDLGEGLGSLSTNLGNSFADLLENTMNLGKNALNGLKLDAELQEDGDFKVKGLMSALSYSDAKWKVDGDDFVIITKEENESESKFKITQRNKDGFTLKKDNLILAFKKK